MKITIYTSPICHYCDDVKSLLNKNKLDYDVVNVVDILQDEKKTKKFLKLTGGVRSVPITVIDKKVVIGYNKDEITKLIEADQNGKKSI